MIYVDTLYTFSRLLENIPTGPVPITRILVSRISEGRLIDDVLFLLGSVLGNVALAACGRWRRPLI